MWGGPQFEHSLYPLSPSTAARASTRPSVKALRHLTPSPQLLRRAAAPEPRRRLLAQRRKSRWTRGLPGSPNSTAQPTTSAPDVTCKHPVLWPGSCVGCSRCAPLQGLRGNLRVPAMGASDRRRRSSTAARLCVLPKDRPSSMARGKVRAIRFDGDRLLPPGRVSVAFAYRTRSNPDSSSFPQRL